MSTPSLPCAVSPARPYFNFGLVRVYQDFNLFCVWNRNTGTRHYFHALQAAVIFAKVQPAANGHNVWADRTLSPEASL